MLKKANRAMNRTLSTWIEISSMIRADLLTDVADHCHDSKNELVQSFGWGMTEGITTGQEMVDITKGFYEKYEDRFFVQALMLRDVAAVFLPAVKKDLTGNEMLRMALERDAIVLRPFSEFTLASN